MPVIKGSKSETQDISGTGKTWTVAANAKIKAEELGIFEDGSSADNRLKILGSVTATVSDEHPVATAVFTFGMRMQMEIEKSARLAGTNGAVAYGDGSSIDNAGKITAGNLGIEFYCYGGSGEVKNSGKVTGDTGIYVYGNDVEITNAKSGKIVGHDNGVWMIETGEGHKLTNLGKIVGQANDGFAVFGSELDDTVINRGTIKGAIDLGNGEDRFEFRGGKLNHAIAGGEGNDLLVTNKASIKLFEQADDGFDTVKASVSYVLSDNVEVLFLLGKKALNGTGSDGYNEITGNAGKNWLKGMGGEDWLDGGKGQDKITGGDGADTFILSKGTGKDTVTDFEDGVDRIFVTGYPDFIEPGDVEGHVEKHGKDTWVKLSSKDILVLKGVDAELVDADDFNFVM